MACGKKAFSTRAEAKAFAASNLKRNGRQRPYLCHDDEEHRRGRVWHLTSQSTNDTEWWREYHARRDQQKKRRTKPYDNRNAEA